MHTTPCLTCTFRIVILGILSISLFTPPSSADLSAIDTPPFISYDRIPTFVGIASDWHTGRPVLHFYDRNQYSGHGDFISRGLKTGLTFRQFKNRVKFYAKRRYLPFLLFDLSSFRVTIGRRHYLWAVQIQDYGYEDNREQMAETALTLARCLEARLKTGKGVFTLATSAKVQPNSSIAPELEQNGYPTRTLYQMLKLTRGTKFKVMTPGVGAGRVVFVGQDTAEPLLTPEDIVIFETLPHRVPPVAGIITLTPQTPLSHVNLLAKNRGTFNVYTTDVDAIPGLKQAIGHYVKIDCSSDRVAISLLTAGQISALRADRNASRILIPEAKQTVRRIIDLAKRDKGYHRVDVIGAKAANYAVIQQAFPANTKPGFALPFWHYFNLIESSGAVDCIDTLMERKQTLSRTERNHLLETLRGRILSGRVHPTTITLIRQLQLRHFPREKIRLRSSTNCEDLAEFNGAGLYLSKGLKPTQGNRKLMRKILEIYASLWSPLAFEEREFYGIDHRKAAMALLINPAFVGERANGVAISIPGPKGHAIVINAQKGEQQVTNPKSGQVPESICFPSSGAATYQVESRSSIGDIFIDNTDLAPLLPQLRDIAAASHKLLVDRLPERDRQRFGVDIEFKIMRSGGTGYRLFIKQLRLLGTTLPG